MRPRVPWLLVLALGAAGCLGAPDAGDGDAPPRDVYLTGGFTENATQEQIERLRAEVEARGGELLVMEIFPLRFQTEGLTEAACQEVRPLFVAAPIVTEVSACLLRQPPTGPPQATSTTPGEATH